MSNSPIQRPLADKKKIHSKDQFELCYLRHQYIRKVKYNPTQEEMRPYIKISNKFARNTYFTYKNLFEVIGFTVADLESIAQVHLVSFLGLFAIEQSPEKYEDFIDLYKHNNDDQDPSENNILDKNKANFTLFLKQRMEDVVRVCRQKARNIKGQTTDSFFVFVGSKRPPRILRNLLEHHEKLGFKKLDIAIYKSIKKRVKPENEEFFFFDNKYYVCVPTEQKSLDLVDFSGANMDPYDNIHNMDPERIYFDSQEQEYWQNKKNQFNSWTAQERAKLMKIFINRYKDNSSYSDEVKAAKKLLKTLEI